MTTQLAGFLTFLGLLAIAGVFFLLHRLRVRQRTVVVETTLFWRHALEETRARVLVQRFRHPWVYAFLVGIAALLWLAFAGLSGATDRDGESLVLIDGSATMARGERFAATVALMQDLVTELPLESRTVVLCAGRPRTVLRPGEHIRLLEERLRDETPVAAPSIIESVVRTHLQRQREGELRIFVAGDAVVDAAFASRLPADVKLTRLSPPTAETAPANGITALGAAPATSGAWDKIDLLVEVRATPGTTPKTPSLTLEGRPLASNPEAEGTGDVRKFIYRDLEATGQRLEVHLEGTDDLALDDTAAIILPDRRRRRVAIEFGLPQVLANVITADPAFVLVSADADVVLRVGGSSFGGNTPAIEFVAADDQTPAFLVQCRENEDPDDVVFQLHDQLGLAEIDATDVARAMGKVIAMGARQGSQRGLQVWRSLLSPEFNFVQSRSFPLFIALSVRWISGVWEAPMTMPAGVPLDLAGAQLTGSDGRKRSSLGDAFTPPIGETFNTDQGQRIAATLLDANVTAPVTPGANLTTVEARAFHADLPTFLMILALACLLLEWVLFQRGRLP